MSKWMVKVTESCIYHIEVEADISDEASEAAYNEFDQMEPHEKEVHFHDWGGRFRDNLPVKGLLTMGRNSKARKRARQRDKRLKHGMPLTKRTAKNANKWERQVGYAVRQLNRQKYFKG